MKRRLIASVALIFSIALFNFSYTDAKVPAQQTFIPQRELFIVQIPKIVTPNDHPDLKIPLIVDPIPVPTIKIKPKPVIKKSVFIIIKTPTTRASQKFAISRIGSRQYSCLYQLWMRESHWNYRAFNKNSGAYGIPQALPGSKMASAGADWKTNPLTQVKWGLKYISGRYGSACNAWNHFINYGWY